MREMNCPKGHGAMEEKKIERNVPFKGVEVNIIEDAFVCPVCKTCQQGPCSRLERYSKPWQRRTDNKPGF